MGVKISAFHRVILINLHFMIENNIESFSSYGTAPFSFLKPRGLLHVCNFQ